MEEQLIKYFSGNASLEEKEKLESWREESEANFSEFFESEQLWKMSNATEVDENLALSSVMGRIEVVGAKMVVEKTTNSFGQWYKYAAAVLLILGVYFVGNKYSQTQSEDLLQVVEAQGNIEIITLPDGSVVSLNGNSKLTYEANFDGKTREVTLEGKAFFDIRRDESKPFIVNTSQSRIEVLGTSFLVNTLVGDASTEVIVKTGKVAVSKRKLESTAQVVELLPGEVGRLDKGSEVFNKSTIENYNYLAWKTKLIEFESEELSSVINLLEEVYGVEITVNNERILACKMSAKFDNQPVEVVLEILSLTFNLELQKLNENDFLLTGEGCINVD